MRHPLLAAVTTALFASLAIAQSATMTVTHDHPSGLVMPGETVRITYFLDWRSVPQLVLGRVRGDAVTSPNLGTASNVGSEFLPGQLVTLGTVSGASVVGVDMYHVPPWATTILQPPFTTGAANLIWFDWTAPNDPGEYRFDYVPHPSVPLIELWPYYGPPHFPAPLFPSPVPTTYTGTSLRVIPAPGSVVVLGVCGVAFASRRRRW